MLEVRVIKRRRLIRSHQRRPQCISKGPHCVLRLAPADPAPRGPQRWGQPPQPHAAPASHEGGSLEATSGLSMPSAFAILLCHPRPRAHPAPVPSLILRAPRPVAAFASSGIVTGPFEVARSRRHRVMSALRIRGSAVRLAAASLLAGAALGITTHGPIAASAQAANDAELVSQSVPLALQPNERAVVAITMSNTGPTTWTAADGYKLGTQNPQDNILWTGGTRIYLPDGVSVAPGETYTFEFPITAPSTPGYYNFRWRMVHEGVEWFGDYTPNVAIAVEAPATTNAALFIAQSVPDSMAPGQSATVSITMLNVGTTTWTTAEGYRLGTESPRDNTLWTGSTRVELPVTVHPWEEATFAFSITAPSAAGDYDFQWRMVQDPVEWFGAFTPPVAIRVAHPPRANGAQFISQSVPTSLAPGERAMVSVTMQNTGTTTWTDAEGYSLGSQNPQDNGLWTGDGRIRLAASAAVAPGEER